MRNQSRLVNAQAQLTSGKRIMRPSDDPTGTAKVLTLKSHIAALSRYRSSAVGAQPGMQLSASALEQGGSVISDAKSLILQGLNGTLSEEDRTSLATELRLQLDQRLDISNTTLGGKHLFSGTNVSGQAYEMSGTSADARYSFKGTEAASSVEIGNNVRTETLLSGQEAFGKFEYSGVSFAGLTGLGQGIRANEGTGFEDVTLRHDSTSGAPGAGVILAGGGAENTILGDHTLTIDGVAGTVTLDGGGPLALPLVGDPDFTDFVVTNEDGAEVHLDFSAYTGGSSTATLSGAGSISIDGTNFTALTFTETDLQLIDKKSGVVLHVDTTNVNRAGVELVGFDGAANVFDALKGAINDLENGHDLKADEMAARLEMRLGEIDRNHENMLQSISVLGARLSRIEAALGTLDGMDTELASHLSAVEDADLASVVTDATQAEQTMQLAQMAGSRLMQNSLLNFLR